MYISEENQLPIAYARTFPAFIDEQLLVGDWQRGDGYHLHYRYLAHPQAKAWVVIMQGRAESVVKYVELIYELYQNGFSVFAFDHVGQGQSGRLTTNPMHGFVKHFDAYVEDSVDLISGQLSSLKQQYLQQDLPLYLIAHSMGGAIATLFLEKHPQWFTKAVLCSPMYSIQAPLPRVLAKWLITAGAAIHKLLGIRSAYFLGQGDYKETPFADNKLTNSQIRYQWFKKYYHDNTDLRIGGVTYQWLAAALQAMDHIAMHAQLIDIPVLGFKASDDEIVDNYAIDDVFSLLPQANLIEISGAKHEILFERDECRKVAVEHILQFLFD